MEEERVLTLHPEGKQGVRIERRVYEDLRRALLRVAGASQEGVAFGDLARLVGPLLDAELWKGRSLMWYVTTVKLDLEARGELERVPGRRVQHLRRPRPLGPSTGQRRENGRRKKA